MFKHIKKLFHNSEKIVDGMTDMDLVASLKSLLDIEDLEVIISNPEAKLYLLSVYHPSFNELLSNILTKPTNSFLISVNVYSYFRDINNLKNSIERLIPIVESNEISFKIQEELTEIVNSFLYLKELLDGK
jgi:hypothetical protein